jgi:hypothetical protein
MLWLTQVMKPLACDKNCGEAPRWPASARSPGRARAKAVCAVCFAPLSSGDAEDIQLGGDRGSPVTSWVLRHLLLVPPLYILDRNCGHFAEYITIYRFFFDAFIFSPFYIAIMAGEVRQPIDIPALERYIDQNVPELKTPLDVKQVSLDPGNQCAIANMSTNAPSM